MVISNAQSVLSVHCLRLSFENLKIKFISNISHNDKNIIEKDENNHFYSKTIILLLIIFFLNLSFGRPILITFCSHGND